MSVRILPVFACTGLALLLAGCTSTARLESERAQTDLVGLEKAALLQCAGVPERTATEENGLEFLSYSSEQTVHVPDSFYGPGFHPSFGFSRHHSHFHNSFIFHGGTRSETRQCTATISIKDGKVTSVSYNQNDPGGLAISQCYQIVRNCLPKKPEKKS